jgi:hypothetical protein
MRRIDENTYIDDTLVTSAEYQLFIDEIREQGKYCQPDHWTSYQFPKGQAREPVLGVRHSDAVAFCEWLTKRDGSEWCYRLPTNVEAREYPLTSKQNSLSLGYWIVDIDEQSRFSWIDRIPHDPRKIAYSHGVNTACDLDPNLNRTIASASKFDRSTKLGFACNLARNLNSELALTFARSLTFDYSNNRFDLANKLNYNSKVNRPLDFDLNIRHPLKLANNHRYYNSKNTLGFTRDIARAFALAIDLELALDRSADLKFYLSHDRAYYFTRALTHALILAYDLPDEFASALDLHIDAFTLEERIAGRSPAFEGIRLVKEQSKSGNVTNFENFADNRIPRKIYP